MFNRFSFTFTSSYWIVFNIFYYSITLPVTLHAIRTPCCIIQHEVIILSDKWGKWKIILSFYSSFVIIRPHHWFHQTASMSMGVDDTRITEMPRWHGMVFIVVWKDEPSVTLQMCSVTEVITRSSSALPVECNILCWCNILLNAIIIQVNQELSGVMSMTISTVHLCVSHTSCVPLFC